MTAKNSRARNGAGTSGVGVVRAFVAASIVASSIVHAHEPDANEVALGALVDAELAFARMGVERGVRDAFLANFADDGIAFEPAPVKLQATWRERPAPADPHALKLVWKPAQAGVARSLDFGYTTGPYTLTRAAQPGAAREGVFFSVWRKDAAGRWKVVLDLGIATPAGVDFAALGAAPRAAFNGRADAAVERRKLLARETHGEAREGGRYTPNDYGQLLAADARLHRDGIAPVVSRPAIAAETARRAAGFSWSSIDAFVARSGDMAVTYGRYAETTRAGARQDGYYAHLWVRDALGAWRIAYDIAVPAS